MLVEKNGHKDVFLILTERGANRDLVVAKSFYMDMFYYYINH